MDGCWELAMVSVLLWRRFSGLKQKKGHHEGAPFVSHLRLRPSADRRCGGLPYRGRCDLPVSSESDPPSLASRAVQSNHNYDVRGGHRGHLSWWSRPLLPGKLRAKVALKVPLARAGSRLVSVMRCFHRRAQAARPNGASRANHPHTAPSP